MGSRQLRREVIWFSLVLIPTAHGPFTSNFFKWKLICTCATKIRLGFFQISELDIDATEIAAHLSQQELVVGSQLRLEVCELRAARLRLELWGWMSWILCKGYAIGSCGAEDGGGVDALDEKDK